VRLCLESAQFSIMLMQVRRAEAGTRLSLELLVVALPVRYVVQEEKMRRACAWNAEAILRDFSLSCQSVFVTMKSAHPHIK